MPDKKNTSALVEVELVITKANTGKDGEMRWMATASDTGKDKANDQTSIALFRDWIERVEKNTTVDYLPEPRRPFLGVSHYPSLDGYGEAGPTEKMYIDGKQFKCCGTFYDDDDHPIGKAVFTALCDERAKIKKGEAVDEPMRISAAWWDLQHAHGDFIFTRKNLTDVCPICVKSDGGGKTYLMGQVDHWAVTRVPMNPRTDLELQEKSEMAKKTRKEDAASIIGADKAEELDERSDLVGKSETEEVPAGMVVKADEEAVTEPDVEKADEGMMERPFGGATDLESARNWIAAQDKLNTTIDLWQTFDLVMMNILESEEEDKVGMMKGAIGEFDTQVAALKAGLSDASLVSLIIPEHTLTERSEEMSEETQVTEDTQEVESQEPAQEDAYTALKQGVEAALESTELTREQKADAIQKSFGDFAGVVKGQLDTQNPPDISQVVEETVAKMMTPITEKMDLLLAKQNQPAAPAEPVQKSLTMHPAEQLGDYQVQKNSIRDIARKSVGLPV